MSNASCAVVVSGNGVIFTAVVVAVADVVDAIVEVECNCSALPRAISQLVSGVSKRRFTANKVILGWFASII